MKNLRLIAWVGAFVSLTLLFERNAPRYDHLANSILKHEIQIACELYDWNLNPIRRYSGDLCLFFPDGKAFVANQKGITLFSPKMSVLWHKAIVFHHTVSLSLDGHDIYGLSSEIHGPPGDRVRYDTVLKINLSGKIIRSFSFFKHRKELDALYKQNTPAYWNAAPSFGENYIDKEYSHANSVYEIPPSPLADRGPIFKAGNVLVYDKLKGCALVLDPDLKTALWALQRDGKAHQHDVQPTPQGTWLTYVNENGLGASSFSTLEEFDPLTGKIHWQYKANPPKNFYSKIQGGIQKLPGGFTFFTDTTDGGKLILLDRNQKVVWRRPVPWKDKKTGRPGNLQSARVIDATRFLQLNSGV